MAIITAIYEYVLDYFDSWNYWSAALLAIFSGSPLAVIAAIVAAWNRTKNDPELHTRLLVIYLFFILALVVVFQHVTFSMPAWATYLLVVACFILIRVIAVRRTYRWWRHVK